MPYLKGRRVGGWRASAKGFARLRAGRNNPTPMAAGVLATYPRPRLIRSERRRPREPPLPIAPPSPQDEVPRCPDHGSDSAGPGARLATGPDTILSRTRNRA
jgi:hypothetical protein